MGTVPAPNFAQYNAPQAEQTGFNNSLAEYARMAGLQSQLSQEKSQSQQEQLKTQQLQSQVQDQQTIRGMAPQYVQKDSDGKVTGYDYDGLLNAAATKGVSPQTIQALQIGRAKARTDLATATKDEMENQDAINSKALGMHEDLKKITDPQERQRAYTTMVGFMKGHGLDTSAYPTQAPQSNDDLAHLEIPLGMHKQIVTEAKSQADAAAADARARAENATAAHQEFVNKLTQNSKPGDFDTQIDAMLPPNDKATGGPNRFVKGQVNAALLRGDYDGAKKYMDQAYENQLAINKETDPRVQAGKVQVAGATAEARQKAQVGHYGEPGDPMIDMVGTNRVDLATALQRVPPAAKEQFLSNLAAKYPEYEQAVYQTRAALRKSATSGDIGKNITAYTTAIAHANQLGQAAEALDNGDLPTLNKLGNALGYQFGSDKTTNFNVIKNALSGEISKVFKGGEATDAEIKAVQEPFSAANSPKQLKGAIDNAIHLMNSKRDALQQQYQQGMQGKPNFGGGSQMIRARDPQGKLHEAPAGTALPPGWKLEQ
jgi:hypothetical protein